MKHIDPLTWNLILTALFLLGMALFGLAMFVLALRYGPGRGNFNQPAAALRKPGRRTSAGMYAVAVLHVIVGIIVAVRVPGAGIGVLVVLVATAGFYVLCAHSYSLATGVMARRTPPAPEAGTPQASTES